MQHLYQFLLRGATSNSSGRFYGQEIPAYLELAGRNLGEGVGSNEKVVETALGIEARYSLRNNARVDSPGVCWWKSESTAIAKEEE